MKWAERWFNIDLEHASKVIDEMFREELLANPRSADAPSIVGDGCELHLSPRGWILWGHLQRDSVLAECYRDAIELELDIQWRGQRVHWPNVATRALDINERAKQLLWIAVEVWQTERTELDTLAEIGEYTEFARLFGRVPVADILLDGIEASAGRYYEQQQSWKYLRFRADILALREEIGASRQVWEGK